MFQANFRHSARALAIAFAHRNQVPSVASSRLENATQPVRLVGAAVALTATHAGFKTFFPAAKAKAQAKAAAYTDDIKDGLGAILKEARERLERGGVTLTQFSVDLNTVLERMRSEVGRITGELYTEPSFLAELGN